MFNNTNRPFSIYRSSAGSGKTYQLALEYVSLVIKDPNLFSKILAVTFTNKATKEMKERILEFLIQLAAGNESDLLSQVMESTGFSAEQIRNNAQEVINKILHQYSQFSVSTIDAFFQRIVKSFAKELGLFGNFKVELDQDIVKQEIIDQLIEDVGENKALTDWLIEFSYANVDENKSWNIRPQVEMLSSEIFKESFRPVSAQLSSINQKTQKSFLEKVKKIRQRFEQQMHSLAKSAVELIETHGLEVADFSYKASGPAGYFHKVLRNDFKPGSRLSAALDDPTKWSSKSSDKRAIIRQVVEGGLHDKTQVLVDYYQEHIAGYVTATEVLKNIYVYGILSQIIKKLESYRQEHDIMLISDVPIFLNGIIAENETPFIYEKTGTWYQHYLMDEFQDTSDYQWQNFKPLVENGLALGEKSLMVGDGKQSIYRWRGGDWNLILNKVEEDLKLFSPSKKFLDTNWRSSRKIVEFNNEIFRQLPTLLKGVFTVKLENVPEGGEEEAYLKEKITAIEMLYRDVSQEVTPKAKSASKGCIEINAYQKIEDRNWKEDSSQELPLAIERVQKAGFQARDIAVLVRTGAEGKKVIEELIRHKKSDQAREGVCYDAISNESLFLGNSTAIRIIISTITFCLNPEDKIAFGEICFNYNHLKNRQDGEGDLGFILEGKELPDDFEVVCQQLILLPVYEMVEQIIRLFQLGEGIHSGYLQTFQDVVLEYFSYENKDINDFLVWWKEKGRRKSIKLPESINAIQVLTIHKSKGLEFKAVLIPFCDWTLDHDNRKPSILWCSSQQKPYNEIGFLPVKYGSALAESYFSKDYFEEMIAAHIDNLNLLYVALTRAKEFLFVNCPPVGKEIRSAGDLLLEGVGKLEEGSHDVLNISKSGDPDIKLTYMIGSLETAPIEKKTSDVNLLGNYKTSDWRDKTALKNKGGIFFSESGQEKAEKINYGVLVHEILAGIKNEEDAGPIIDRYYQEGRISREEKMLLVEQLNRIFANKQVQSWFNTSWEVKTESSIIISNTHPQRPDRVLIKGNSAIIIDFKTGLEKPSDQRQILSYKEILSKMGFTNIECFLLYLGLDKVIKVA